MKVIVTDAAWNDLLAIGRTIQADNPKRAETFIEEIYQSCGDLADMPFAFSTVPGHEASGIRRRRNGNYLIFYRVAERHIEVLHVLHAARDYERIVFDDQE